MKTFKGILYGVAIAIAVSAGAATVYNYFPPPGMTYSPTAGFTVGTPTGGAQGAGTINAQGVFVNGSAVSVKTIANPSGTVGLTAVNGSTGNVMDAGSAPPLSQSIAPTWTGAHIWTGAGTPNLGPILIENNSPTFGLQETDQGTDGKNWRVSSNGGSYLVQLLDDATTTVKNALKFDRSAAVLTNMTFGNATDNPTFQFSGSGSASFNGPINANSSTGVALTVNGTSGNTALVVNPQSAATGIAIVAPTANTASIALRGNNNAGSAGGVVSQDGSNNVHLANLGAADIDLDTNGSNRIAIKSTGGVLIGSPTGGDKGAGTINAVGLYVGGVAVGTGGGTPGGSSGQIQYNNGGVFGGAGLVFTSPTSFSYNTVPFFTVNGTTNTFSYGGSGAGDAFPVLARYNAGSGGSDTMFYHSRGASVGTNTILQANDETGSISFMGSDGTGTPVRNARIIGLVDGTPSAGTSYPGRIEFYTVPVGSTTIAKALTIDSTQTLTATQGINAGGSIGTVKTNAGGGIQVSAQNNDAASNNSFAQVLSANSSHSFHHLITGTAQTTAFITNGFAGEGAYEYTDAGVPLCIGSAGACRMNINTSGAITVNAPSSGPAVSITGVAGSTALTLAAGGAGQDVLQIRNTAGSTAFGLYVQAGSSSSDYNTNWTNNSGGTTYMRLYGDGGLTVGNNPTGGDQGAGVVNVSSDLRVNNVSACLSNGANCGPAGRVTLAWSGTCNGSGCVSGVSKNVSSVVRNSAGNYTVNESSSIGSSSVCTVSTFGSVNSGLFMHMSSVLASTVNVLSVNSSGTQTDVLGFSIICMS